MENGNQVKTPEIQTQLKPEQQIGIHYSSRVARYAAVSLDGIILGLINLPVRLIISIFANALNSSSSTSSIISVLLLSLIWGLIFMIISVLYYVISIHKYGMTLGKRFFGLEVQDEKTGGRLSLGKSFFRETLGKFISGIVFYLGYLSILWDKKRQGWHDKLAGDIVIQKIPLAGGKKIFAYFLFILGILVPILAVMLVAGVTAFQREVSPQINGGPSIQIQMANDVKVKNDISQIGTAMQSFYAVNQYYPNTINDLVSAGELTVAPIVPTGYMSYSIVASPRGCTTALRNCKSAVIAGQLKSPTVLGNNVWCFSTTTGTASETDSLSCTGDQSMDSHVNVINLIPTASP